MRLFRNHCTECIENALALCHNGRHVEFFFSKFRCTDYRVGTYNEIGYFRMCSITNEYYNL